MQRKVKWTWRNLVTGLFLSTGALAVGSLLLLGLLMGSALLPSGAVELYGQRRALRKALLPLAGRHWLEGPANRLSYAELADNLEFWGHQFSDHLAGLLDSPKRRETLRHIIGMERWGQARLESLQDGSLSGPKSHRPFKPDEGLDLAALRDQFNQTRTRSIQLARALDDTPPAETARSIHAEFGPLNAKAWLRFLNVHVQVTPVR